MEFTDTELIVIKSALEDKLINLERINKEIDVSLNIEETKKALKKVKDYLNK